MPVRIDLSSKDYEILYNALERIAGMVDEFSAIAQLGKDYEILYRALERISDMVDENHEMREMFPFAMKKVANMALDDVTIRP